MGMGAELYIEQELERFLSSDLKESLQLKVMAKAVAGYWQTKDGRVLKISDMTTEHLKNTVRLFEGSPVVEILKLELLSRE